MSQGKSRYTTIAVRPDLRDRLRRLKTGGQSYGELLEHMANEYETSD